IATAGRGRPVWLRSWLEMKGVVYVVNGISKGLALDHKRD
ncbi:unnamed protein product, partial [Brassica oleracea var. botrytis]